jgi:hypothetical protein
VVARLAGRRSFEASWCKASFHFEIEEPDMLTALILAVSVAALTDGPAKSPSGPDLDALKEVAASAGKSADAHVRVALWCEARGLTAERLKHLSLAVLYDPGNTLARGLMGLVAYHGKWDRPDVVGSQIQNDPQKQAIVREYLDRRSRTADKAEAQMKLAAWCQEKGLKEQAQAHYSAVTRLDPSREAAWKHLGLKKQGGRWVKPEEAALAKQEANHQKVADKHWKPRLEKLRDGLESKDSVKRMKAEHGLSEVTDPRAVPAIWTLFLRGSERHQVAAVQMLGQIDGPSASNGLAVLAVFSPRPEVRRRAMETLKRRDPRDVVGKLIGLVKKPFKYQVRHPNGPGSPGELFVEGEKFNIQRLYINQQLTMFTAMGRIFTPDVPFDPFNLRNLMMATIPNHLTAANLSVSGNQVMSSYPMPLSPQSVSLAAQEIVSNPQNANAILGGLINNQANRFIPAGYWFEQPQANGVTQFTPVTSPGVQNGPASASTMQQMSQHLAVQNQAAINQLRANQSNPNSLLGEAAKIKRLESNPANFGAGIVLDGMQSAQSMAIERDLAIGQELEQIRLANLDLEQRLVMDTQYIEATNAGINLCNGSVLPVLEAITGQGLGAEPDKWKSWWTDQLGYAYESDIPVTKPTYTQFVNDSLTPAHSACFAVGTVVQTIDGPRPIESIHLGDRVLSQGTASGQLAFQPVLATHHNAPAATLRLKVGDESIVATAIHRFWKAGAGWTMARELKAGDRLRIIGGTVVIDAIETDLTQAVYNLEVAENRDFFVGAGGLLVHDFSFVQPVAEPFDRQADPASPVPRAR